MTVILSLLALVIIVSCHKEEEKYSCSPEIDKWVKTNKNSLADLSREQIAMVPFKYQTPIVRTFSAQKKLSLWQEKMQIVLNGNWDTITRIKIIELKNKMDIVPFNDPTNEDWVKFAEDWENDILGNYGMDSVQFLIHFCTLMTFEELDKRLNHADEIDLTFLAGYEDLIDSYVHGGGSTAPVDCGCRYDIYCSALGGVSCASGCATTDTGCGIFGSSSCTGNCPENSN